MRKAAQDIAPLPHAPAGEWKDVRERCGNLQSFLEEIFPNAFTLDWSPDHVELIAEIEKCVREGELKAIAMPRGSGKTSIIVRSALWAILNGHRSYVVIVAATETAALKLLTSIKSELLYNDRLAKVYAQEIHSLRSLDGEARLAAGQRFNGMTTNAQWAAKEITFGTIPDVATSGARISTVGLTGNVRGQQFTRPDGVIARPDFVLIDDFQTKESAASRLQSQTRHEIMMGDVLGMAGPGRRIAGLATGTVIYNRDAMDRLLNLKVSGVWKGKRCKLVYEWPEDADAWERYRELYEDTVRKGLDLEICNQYVRDNYEQMHKGGVAGWEQRKNAGEVSWLQHAYNLRYRDETAFWAEYMNEPLTQNVDAKFDIDSDELVQRTNGCPWGVVPADCQKITAFIDVQQEVLLYTVVAWEMCGRGHVLDFGAWPDQGRTYFTKRALNNTLQRRYGSHDLNKVLYAGLRELTEHLFTKRWPVQMQGRGEVIAAVDRVGIDARWGYSTHAVRRFCRESKHVGRIFPMMGQYIGVDNMPWHQWTHKKTDWVGKHCKLQAPPKGTRGVYEFLVDTNWWKTWVATRLTSEVGGDDSIQFFDGGAARLRLMADHCAVEEATKVIGKSGNQTVIWKYDEALGDNDLWDGLVGCSVLASVEGVRVEDERDGREQKNPKPRKREERTNRTQDVAW